MKKHVKNLLQVALLLLAALLLILIILLFQKFRTIFSVKKISKAPAYEMNYHGSYSLKEYLKTGASSQSELRKFLIHQFTYGLDSFITKEHGCSAFFARTPEGDLILARNFDTSSGTPCVLSMDNSDGYSYLGMSNLAWLFKDTKEDFSFKDKFNLLAAPYVVMDGMNEYGLCCAGFTASGSKASYDPSKTTLLDCTISTVLLSQAQTVEEAVEVLQNYNIKMDYSSPSHYMVCDATGNSAVIEFVKGSMQVIYKKENYQICSNFILYANSILNGFGSDRYRNYEAVLKETNGIISTEDALALLQQNTIPSDEQWSVVYNLTKKTLTATFYGDYEHTYSYSFRE